MNACAECLGEGNYKLWGIQWQKDWWLVFVLRMKLGVVGLSIVCIAYAFGRAGVSSKLASFFLGIANLIGSAVALLLMDKGISMALQVLAANLSVSSPNFFYLYLTGMLLFVLMFAIGAGPVPALLLSEIFPNGIRAKAMAFCMSVLWVLNFLVGLMFLQLLDQVEPQWVYSIFCACCFLAVVVVKQNVMETKGKSLQEIEIALFFLEISCNFIFSVKFPPDLLYFGILATFIGCGLWWICENLARIKHLIPRLQFILSTTASFKLVCAAGSVGICSNI